MKILISLLALSLASQVFAAQLKCHALPTNENFYSAPQALITGTVSAAYRNQAVDLKVINNLTVTNGTTTIKDKAVQADATYRPRSNKNRARFYFSPFDATVALDGTEWDGVFHGLILPKKLFLPELAIGRDGSFTFNAQLISSTDSYHDGIMSYFPISCNLK